MSTLRDIEQQKTVDLFISSNPLRSTVVLSTGFGKSKVAIDIFKKLDPERKIIILVNSTILRDTNWKAEFEKFDAMDIFDRTELHTYQAAYKWKKSDRNLDDYFVLADECDFAADTDELSKFFYEYSDVQILGMTGFITDSKKVWFDNNLPVIKMLLSSEAQNKNILNKTHFIFVKYNLSTNKNDVTVEYKQDGITKTFTQSENNAYDYHARAVQNVMIEESTINMEFLNGEITFQEQQQKLKKLEWKMNQAVKKRNDVLLKSVSSVVMTKKLIKYFSKDSNNKIIVFSKRTEQSNSICGKTNVYNGTITKKKADEVFKKFQDGDINLLGVCDKVNRGANIPNLNIGILETFYGSDTKATQRLGRLMRLNVDQVAKVVILLPYYMRSVRKPDGTYEFKQSETQ